MTRAQRAGHDAVRGRRGTGEGRLHAQAILCCRHSPNSSRHHELTSSTTQHPPCHPPAWSLQQSVFAALTADAALTALLGAGRIFDDVPQGSAAPLPHARPVHRPRLVHRHRRRHRAHPHPARVVRTPGARSRRTRSWAPSAPRCTTGRSRSPATASSTCATNSPKPAAIPTARPSTASPASAPSPSLLARRRQWFPPHRAEGSLRQDAERVRRCRGISDCAIR